MWVLYCTPVQYSTRSNISSPCRSRCSSRRPSSCAACAPTPASRAGWTSNGSEGLGRFRTHCGMDVVRHARPCRNRPRVKEKTLNQPDGSSSLFSSRPAFAGARDRMRAPWIGVLRSRRRMDARFDSASRHDINPKEANVAKQNTRQAGRREVVRMAARTRQRRHDVRRTDRRTVRDHQCAQP